MILSKTQFSRKNLPIGLTGFLFPVSINIVIQAFAGMDKYDDALSSINDLWGGEINYGGTTFFEVSRPSWDAAIGVNDPVPNCQCGWTSLCHPWSAGVVKWLSEEGSGHQTHRARICHLSDSSASRQFPHLCDRTNAYATRKYPGQLQRVQRPVFGVGPGRDGGNRRRPSGWKKH